MDECLKGYRLKNSSSRANLSYYRCRRSGCSVNLKLQIHVNAGREGEVRPVKADLYARGEHNRHPEDEEEMEGEVDQVQVEQSNDGSSGRNAVVVKMEVA